MRLLKLFNFAIVILLMACSSRVHLENQKHYYGLIDKGGWTKGLYLRMERGNPKLTIIGVRGYPVTVKRVPTQKDSLRFRGREDVEFEFKGLIQTDGQIRGSWFEKGSEPLTFVFKPALQDTIKGLNPRTTPLYRYAVPPHNDDQITVADRADQGMNGRALDSLVGRLIQKKYRNVHAMLVARNNMLVMEEYFYGYQREAPFGIQSATKSIVSALVGIALYRHEIPSLDTTLCRYLKEQQPLVCSPKNKSITLREALTMTTGLAWDEATYNYGEPRNTSMIAYNSGDELKYLFTRQRSAKRPFAYNSLNHYMMNLVLADATGIDNATEIKTRLLQPLGISNFNLGNEYKGALGDIFLRPRDMLKFGLLYLNHGAWGGKQLVPREWIAESTTFHTKASHGLGYGYFWWTKPFEYHGQRVDSYFAWGYGGQYIFVVPDLQLVVVFIGSNWTTEPTRYGVAMMAEIVSACE